MKKNKMMRLASLLLVLCLLTISVISGTFAKYTTSDSAKDSARVAKWGVTVEIDSNGTDSTDLDLFNVEYTTDETGEGAYTGVSVQGDTNLVAPGTTGTINFKITGTPEVASRVTVKLENANAIKLTPDTYELKAGKWVGVDTTKTIDKVYEPIVFYLYEADAAEKGTPMTLTDLASKLNGTDFNKTYAPGDTLDLEYTLEWAWAFEGNFNDASGNNVADFLDTVLGNEAPAQTEKFDLSITVEQID